MHSAAGSGRGCARARTYATASGLVEVTAVEPIAAESISAGEARRAGAGTCELAEQQGRELHAFKRDVRKRKELGLDESLERGYRVSPRTHGARPHPRIAGLSTHRAPRGHFDTCRRSVEDR